MRSHDTNNRSRDYVKEWRSRKAERGEIERLECAISVCTKAPTQLTRQLFEPWGGMEPNRAFHRRPQSQLCVAPSTEAVSKQLLWPPSCWHQIRSRSSGTTDDTWPDIPRTCPTPIGLFDKPERCLGCRDWFYDSCMFTFRFVPFIPCLDLLSGSFTTIIRYLDEFVLFSFVINPSKATENLFSPKKSLSSLRLRRKFETFSEQTLTELSSQKENLWNRMLARKESKMVDLINREDVLIFVNTIRENIRALKKAHFIFGVVVVSFLFYNISSSHKNTEIRAIQNSLQKFYQEFSPYMLIDIEEFKKLVERVKGELDQPLSDLKEIRKASVEAKEQIEILQNYGIDKTGLVDLALYNSGGRIAGIGKDTQLFYSCGFLWKLLGCPGKKQGPQKVIQALMYPEECFRFKGQHGAVYIRLRKPALIDRVTIEHLPRKMSLTGEVTSAPRNFSVSVSLPRFIARASRAVKREMKKFSSP